MSASVPIPTASVLVVDDDPAMLHYTQTLLELDGHRVETAGSGLDAVRRVGQDPPPDLALLDLLMPGLDGLQTLQQIRQVNPAVKVVILSCVTESRKVVQAIRLGAFDYLSKPFSQNDLQRVLQPCIPAKLRQPASAGA